jgi:hypothetical protein
MSSRTLLNLMLAAVALLLGLLVFYQSGHDAKPVSSPITALSADSISSIRVTRKERTPLSFAKTSSGWQLLNEQPLPASKFQLQALLSVAGTRPDRSYPVSALDPGSAGLDPPQATLLLNDTVFYIGNTEPLDGKRYILHDDTVFLADDIYQHLINADWTNFVERRLLPENAALSSIELPGLSLTVNEAGNWQPSTAATDGNTIDTEDLVRQWKDASATYIRRYDGTATPVSVTLAFSDDTEPVTLYLNESQSELVLARPDWGLQYHLPAEMRTALLGLPDPDTAARTGPDTLLMDSTAPLAP